MIKYKTNCNCNLNEFHNWNNTDISAASFAAWKEVMVTIIKFWRHINNPTPSVDAYLREE